MSRKKLTNKVIDERLIHLPDKIYRLDNIINTYTKINWKCEHGHMWSSKPSHILRGHGCPVCKQRATLTNRVVDERLSRKDEVIYRSGKVVNSKTKIKWKCEYDHEWEASPDNILNKGTGCPVCNKKGLYSKSDNNLNIFANIYFIRFEHKTNKSSFVKIGITKRTITQRYNEYIKYFNIEVLYLSNIPLPHCVDIEQEIIHKFHKYQYIPEGKFGGKTECFTDTQEVKESILKLLE